VFGLSGGITASMMPGFYPAVVQRYQD
jgi:hypothetical protein